MLICSPLRSPTGVFFCLTLGFLNQPTKTTCHSRSPQGTFRGECGNTAVRGLTGRIWMNYKSEFTQDFLQDSQEYRLYFITVEKSFTLLLSPRPKSQLAQHKARQTNMPIMVKVLQFSVIIFTYRMLWFFTLSKNGHVSWLFTESESSKWTVSHRGQLQEKHLYVASLKAAGKQRHQTMNSQSPNTAGLQSTRGSLLLCASPCSSPQWFPAQR